MGMKYVPAGALVRRSRCTRGECCSSCGGRSGLCTLTITQGSGLMSFLHRGGCRGMGGGPGVALCSKATSFLSRGAVHVISNGSRAVLRKGRVFVGAKSAPVLPTVSKLGRDGCMCADRALLRSGGLPTRLLIVNNNTIKLRFTAVCTNFKDRIALLRTKGHFLPGISHSVTTSVLRTLGQGHVGIQLGTHIRSICSATRKVALACASDTGNAPCCLGKSTLLMTVNHGPVATRLGLRGTNVRASGQKTVIISGRLQAATPRM